MSGDLNYAHIHVQAQAYRHTCTRTNVHVLAYTHTCTGTGWAKCPPGLVQGRLKHLITGSGVFGVTLNIFEIGRWGEYGKVQYVKRWL